MKTALLWMALVLTSAQAVNPRANEIEGVVLKGDNVCIDQEPKSRLVNMTSLQVTRGLYYFLTREM